MYESFITVDPSKTIASLELTNKGSAYPTILAVSKEYQEVVSGIENNVANTTALIVYPTPVRNGEKLKVLTGENARIKLVSLQGSILMQTEATSHTTELPINGMAAGIYILTVEDGTRIQTAKVIVR